MGRRLLYVKIYEHLKEEIVQGRFKPGDRIPTEQELMGQFGVSRMTTNRALQMLTVDGLVVRKAGLGTTVAGTMSTDVGQANGPPIESSISEPKASAECHTIGFVIPYLHFCVGPLLVSTVEHQLHDRNMVLSIGCSHGAQETEEAIIDKLVEAGAEGLIVFPLNGEYYNPSILRLHVRGFPIVLVDKPLPGIPLPYITTDNQHAAQSLMEHLIDLGHKQIAFVSHPWTKTTTLSDRFEGYQHSLQSAGLPIDSKHLLMTNHWSHTPGHFHSAQVDQLCDFLNEHPEITAVFAVENLLAEYLILAAEKVGKRVPDDLSIVCFDSPPPRTPYFTFTCALQDEVNMALHAVRILSNLMDGQSAATESVVLPAKIHIGQSTARVNGVRDDIKIWRHSARDKSPV